jgi:hypothetical protein
VAGFFVWIIFVIYFDIDKMAVNKEPVLSETPKCVAEGCWYGIIENDDETVGLCSECLGTGVAH